MNDKQEYMGWRLATVIMEDLHDEIRDEMQQAKAELDEWIARNAPDRLDRLWDRMVNLLMVRLWV